MSKAKFQANFVNIAEREFNIKETMGQLTHFYSLYACWGVSGITNYYNKGLLLNVNGRHVKGFVFITLSWNDTYTVRFYNAQYNECKPMISEVYCDELAKRIDTVIEYVPEYRY